MAEKVYCMATQLVRTDSILKVGLFEGEIVKQTEKQIVVFVWNPLSPDIDVKDFYLPSKMNISTEYCLQGSSANEFFLPAMKMWGRDKGELSKAFSSYVFEKSKRAEEFVSETKELIRQIESLSASSETPAPKARKKLIARRKS